MPCVKKERKKYNEEKILKKIEKRNRKEQKVSISLKCKLSLTHFSR